MLFHNFNHSNCGHIQDVKVLHIGYIVIRVLTI